MRPGTAALLMFTIGVLAGCQDGKKPDDKPPPTVPERADVSLDLDIHDGQGGDEGPEDKEETLGVLTVANLNDTDGDGTIDRDDATVKATANGRDEVDLMKLMVRKPVPDMGDKVKLTILQGDVKLWLKSTKETEAPTLELATADLPKTLWVEARAASGAIRDIVIKADYKGAVDTVKATAIWAERTKFTNTGAALSADVDGRDIKATFDAKGQQLGAAHVSSFTNNGMETEFTVKPPGIGSEPGVVLDITRQGEGKWWDISGGVVTEDPAVARTFPIKDEEPNDDADSLDEDNEPKNDHIYSVDFIGYGGDVATQDRAVYRYNFREFVRVQFGRLFRNNNGLVEGSRCSERVPWRARLDVVKVAATSKWKRNAAGENEVETGHKAIGAAPP